MEKFPSKSVTVPIFVPSMITFTPGIELMLSASLTDPEI